MVVWRTIIIIIEVEAGTMVTIVMAIIRVMAIMVEMIVTNGNELIVLFRSFLKVSKQSSLFYFLFHFDIIIHK